MERCESVCDWRRTVTASSSFSLINNSKTVNIFLFFFFMENKRWWWWCGLEWRHIEKYSLFFSSYNRLNEIVKKKGDIESWIMIDKVENRLPFFHLNGNATSVFFFFFYMVVCHLLLTRSIYQPFGISVVVFIRFNKIVKYK